ncbi:MAG: hypothetical protein WCO54_11450, partial [Bacteroidota bacterium]
MKQIKRLVAIILASTSIYCFAQNSDTSFLGTFNYPYQLLDTSVMSTYFLYDKAPHYSVLNSYDGVRDTIITPQEFIQSYLEMFNIRSKMFKMVNIDTVINRMLKYGQQGITPLLIMNFKYNTIKNDAVANGLLDTLNNQYLDDTNRYTTPYSESILFAFCPAFIVRKSNIVKFKLASDLVFTDQSNLPNIVSVDFGDGQGYRGLRWDEEITISYEDTTYREIKVRYSNGSDLLYSKGGNLGFYKTDIYGKSQTFVAEIEYANSGLAAGTIEVLWGLNPDGTPKDYGHYPNGNAMPPCYTKPLIFAEGIDFGYSLVGNINPLKNGTTGLYDLMNGQTFNYETGKFEPFPAIVKGPMLIDKLRRAGYDIIYLDYLNGSCLMQSNAMVLVELLNKINSEKCTNEELVVVGASMGGQVVKYALSYMEKNNMSHCVKLYVSWDSPHQGANITYGVQQYLHYHERDAAEAKFAIDKELRSSAAKQLLLNHFDSYVLDSKFHLHNSGGQNSLRTIFMNELYGFTGTSLRGYPQKTRNIAIANGSKNMSNQGFVAGNLLLQYIWTLSMIGKNEQIWALCGDGNSKVFWDQGTFSDDKFYAPYNCLSLDHAPGGKTKLFFTLRQPLIFKGVLLGGTYVPYDYSCFIPTVSALDIKNNTDPFYDIMSNLNFDDRPIPDKYPFDAYYAPLSNELHVQLTDGTGGNIDWLMNQLNIMDNTLPITLPNTNGNTYNIGYAPNYMGGSIVINNNGVLNINANQATNYGSGALSVPGSTFRFSSQNDCISSSSSITINSGGSFILGDATPSGGNNKAIVTIKGGGELNINSAATLIIYDNSKLIIESGATLNISGTPNIILNGTNAIIEIQDGAVLNIPTGASLTNFGSGFFKLYGGDGTQTIITGGGAINLLGSGKNNKVIEFASSSKGNVLHIANTIQSFNVTDGKILNDCKISFLMPVSINNGNLFNYRTIDFLNSLWANNSTFSGVNNCYDNMDINLCSLYGPLSAVAINYPKHVNITRSTFTYADNGNGALNLYGTNDVVLEFLNFVDNGIGLNAEYITGRTTCQQCKFFHTDNNFAMKGVAFSGSTGSSLYLDRTDITNMQLSGVEIEGGELFANCGKIVRTNNYDPSVGVRLNTGAVLTIDQFKSGGVTVGNMDFSGHINTINATDAEMINIDNGYSNLNNLLPNEFDGNALLGHITNKVIQLDAQYNFWNLG